MSNIGEAFSAMKERSKEKRHANLLSSTKKLKEENITYNSFNEGIHLQVDSFSGKIDFWPSTGKWIAQNPSKTGRGVFKLIKYITRLEKLGTPFTEASAALEEAEFLAEITGDYQHIIAFNRILYVVNTANRTYPGYKALETIRDYNGN